jgi:predicted outer membrane repeat protein
MHDPLLSGCDAAVRCRSYAQNSLILTAPLFALLSAFPLPALSATCHLPGDHITLQGCIDAIADGDTVLVAPGTYIGPGNRDIHTDGKSVTVIGEAGAETTIFDAEQATLFFTFATENETTRIEGLTLRNGNNTLGGAVHIGFSVAGTGPSFAECRFIANRSSSGGAVMNEGDALVRFTRCHFEGNTAGDSGGAIDDRGRFIESDVTLEDCTLIQNAAFVGGAIGEQGHGALNIAGCVFTDNSARRGGALYLNEVISRPGQSASGPGQSASGWERPPGEPDAALRDDFGLVTDCTFVSNKADAGGAVLFASNFTPAFQRCLFTDNVAVQGGAISGTNGLLTSCTLVGNRGDSGAAVYDAADLSFWGHDLVKCIVAFNGPDQAIRRPHFNGCLYLQCCDLFGNEGGDWVGCIAGLLGTAGNISADPLFCDPQGGDFTLNAASPCAPENSPAGCGLIGALPVACGMTAVAAGEATSVEPRLRIAPNPVWGAAEFALPGMGVRVLAIFDSQGRLVDRLTTSDGRWVWAPGTTVPAGIYFANVEGAAGQSVKFIRLR